MAEGQPDVMGAWLCANREQFEKGPRTYCPPEGCPKGYCARDDDAWLPGMPTPDRALHVVDLSARAAANFDREEGKLLATLAIDNIADGLAEITRYRREGSAGKFPFGCTDVVAHLAEALEQIAQIEAQALERNSEAETASSELAALGQLQGALTKFLSDQGIRPAT